MMVKSVNIGVTPDYYIPTEMFVRDDILAEMGSIMRKYGSRAVLITTAQDFLIFQDVVEKISSVLNGSGIGCIVFDELPLYPNTEYIDSASYFAKKTKCDMVIGFGGIESINAAKAISLLINNYVFCEEIFETSPPYPPVNLITVPSYPLFGFEVLPMLYLTEIHEMTKKVYSQANLFPRATIVDPKIALAIDEETTANTAVSSLAISTESVISKRNNGLINTLALRAIDLTFKNLPIAYKDPKNSGARLNLAAASIMSGIAFSVAELSVSLAVSLAISSRMNLPVESAMGVILPHIMEYNLTASPGKYVQMSKVMDEDVKDITVIEAAIKAVEGVRKMEIDVDIPQRLSQFDIQKTDLSRIAEIAITYPFLEQAPRPLTKNEIETILIAAF